MIKKLLTGAAIALLLAAGIPLVASARSRGYHMRTYHAHIIKLKIKKIKIYHQ